MQFRHPTASRQHSFPRRPRANWVRRGLVGILAAMVLPVAAQLPQTRLTTIFPPGARTGSTQEVAVAGSDLDEADRLQFSDPRIVAKPSGGGERRFQIAVPADLEPGIVEVRVAGRFGVSNPRLFALGAWPELTPATLASTATNPTDLPLETVLNGRVPPNQYLWFRSNAEPGRRLGVEVEAREVDSRLVPDLAVLDMDGREIALARRRAWLDFQAPKDGRFVVRLNDQTFRGGEEYPFRLRVTAAPHVEFAVPPVLRAGETNAVTLYGRRLPNSRTGVVPAPDGRPWEELPVSIVAPASAPPALSPRKPAAAVLADAAFAWSFVDATGRARPLVFTLSTQAIVIADTTHTDSPPVTLTPPCDLAGLFPRQPATAVARFHARTGEVFTLELFADRLGFNADPWALVQRLATNAAGQPERRDVVELTDLDANPGGRDFDLSSRDGTGRFQAPADGEYVIRLRDQYQSPATPKPWPFALEIRRANPDFRLAAVPQPPPRLNDADRQIHLWTTVVRRGQTVPIRVLAFRRDGFDGEIEVVATNLPTGLSSSPGRIPAGQFATSLLLTADPDAPFGDSRIRVLGRARNGDTSLEHAATAGTAVWPVPDWDQERGNSRPSLGLSVSICSAEASPVVVAPASDGPWDTTSTGKLSIPLVARRSAGFTAAFKMKAFGSPEIEKAKEIEFPENATNAVLDLNPGDLKIGPGTHPFWLQGMVAGKYRNNPEALSAAEASLKAAEKAVADASPETRAAAEEKRKAAEATRKAAEEKAKPRDVTVAVYSPLLRLKVLPTPAEPPK